MALWSVVELIGLQRDRMESNSLWQGKTSILQEYADGDREEDDPEPEIPGVCAGDRGGFPDPDAGECGGWGDEAAQAGVRDGEVCV